MRTDGSVRGSNRGTPYAGDERTWHNFSYVAREGRRLRHRNAAAAARPPALRAYSAPAGPSSRRQSPRPSATFSQ